MMYHPLKNPSSLSKLREEVDEAAVKGRIFKYVIWKESQTLPYLEACVKEAIRMHLSFLLSFEQVVPESGLDIDSYFIPGDARIGVVNISPLFSCTNYSRRANTVHNSLEPMSSITRCLTLWRRLRILEARAMAV